MDPSDCLSTLELRFRYQKRHVWKTLELLEILPAKAERTEGKIGRKGALAGNAEVQSSILPRPPGVQRGCRVRWPAPGRNQPGFRAWNLRTSAETANRLSECMGEI